MAGKGLKTADRKFVPQTTKSFGKFMGSQVGAGAVSSLKWTVGVTIGLGAAWKAANFAFSQAYRKCGFSKGPGKKLCMARERIKILNQKATILNKVLSGCGKTKDPEMCKQQTQLEIDKIKNKIELNKNKLKEVNEIPTESFDINEQAVIAGVAASMVAMTAADFVTKKAWRTTLAIFSQASRKCGIYKTGPERESCMAKWKLVSLNKQLGILNQVGINCAKNKNPEECKMKNDEKIEKLKTQIQLQNDNMRLYAKEAETLRKEKEMKEAEKEASKNNSNEMI